MLIEKMDNRLPARTNFSADTSDRTYWKAKGPWEAFDSVATSSNV